MDPPILARSRSARRTRAGKAELSGRNARIPLILFQVDYQRLLERAMAAAAATAGRGQVADYIPALASVDPDAFGMAMATFDGEIYGVGQVERPFSIQSVSKLFSLALLLAEIGDRVWQGVGREPSGNPFNSLVQLESERGIRATRSSTPVPSWLPTGCCRPPAMPLGPCASSCGPSPGTRSWTPTRWSPGPRPSRGTATPPSPISSPATGTCRTRSTGCWTTTTHTAPSRRAAATSPSPRRLSKHGLRVDGRRLLGRTDAKRMNAVMLTCGTDDAAGEFATGSGSGQERGRRGRAGRDPPARHPMCLGSTAECRGQLGGRDRRP